MKTDTRVEALRRQVEQERAASKSGRGQYPAELKRSILALLQEPMWGRSRVSKTLGLAQSVLARWAKSERVTQNRFSMARSTPSENLKRMTIVPMADAARTFEIVFPSGAKVAALTWNEISRLVRGGE